MATVEPMKTALSIRVLAVLVWLLPRPAEADVLRGHLSGLDQPDAVVDLRIGFFSSDVAERLLAEKRFEAVSLTSGHFRVRLTGPELPSRARFVEIALRPSERRYAAFRHMPPRRRLRRLENGTLVAAVDPDRDPSGKTITSRTAAPKSITPGEP